MILHSKTLYLIMFIILLSSVNALDITQDLLAYYSMDTSTASKGVDDTANSARNLTASGTPDLATSLSLLGGVSLHKHQNDYYQKTGSYYQFYDHTFSFWIYANSTEESIPAGDTIGILDKDTTGSASNDWSVAFDNWRMHWQLGCGSNDWLVTIGNWTRDYNKTWVHFVLVRNGTTRTIYVNNQFNVTKESGSCYVDGNNPFYLGRYYSDADGDYYTDEVAIYNRTLSTWEIGKLYNDGTGFNPLFGSVMVEFWSQTPVNNSGVYTDTSMNFILYGMNSTGNCTVYVNNIEKEENTGLSNGLNSFTYQTSWGNEGYNTINLSCVNDGPDGGSTSENKTIWVDTNIPAFAYVNMINDSTGNNFPINGSYITEDLHFNISVTDDNVYLFNFSVCKQNVPNYCPWKDFVNGIDSTSFNYTNTSGIGNYSDGGNYSFKMEVCDSHTLMAIPMLASEETPNGGIIGLFNISVQTADQSSFVITKHRDRYKFDIHFSSGKSTIVVDLTSTRNIDQIGSALLAPSAQYMAHFVSGKQWIDFTNSSIEIDSVQQITDQHYRITMSTIGAKSKSVWSFDSTGMLNCVNRTDTAYIYIDPPLVTHQWWWKNVSNGEMTRQGYFDTENLFYVYGTIHARDNITLGDKICTEDEDCYSITDITDNTSKVPYEGATQNTDLGNYNLTASWIKATNLNVTGTSYLGDLVLESENISVNNIKEVTSGYGINIQNDTTILGNLNVTGSFKVNNITASTAGNEILITNNTKIKTTLNVTDEIHVENLTVMDTIGVGTKNFDGYGLYINMKHQDMKQGISITGETTNTAPTGFNLAPTFTPSSNIASANFASYAGVLGVTYNNITTLRSHWVYMIINGYLGTVQDAYTVDVQPVTLTGIYENVKGVYVHPTVIKANNYAGVHIAKNTAATENNTLLLLDSSQPGNNYTIYSSYDWPSYLGGNFTVANNTKVEGNLTVDGFSDFDNDVWISDKITAEEGNFTTGFAQNSAEGHVYMGSYGADPTWAPIEIHQNTDVSYWTLLTYNDVYSATDPIFAYYGWNNGNFSQGTEEARDLCFYTNSYSNERLCIQADGDVLIKPNLKLMFNNEGYSIYEQAGASNNFIINSSSDLTLDPADQVYVNDNMTIWNDLNVSYLKSNMGNISLFRNAPDILDGSTDSSSLQFWGEKSCPHSIYQDLSGRFIFEACDDDIVFEVPQNKLVWLASGRFKTDGSTTEFLAASDNLELGWVRAGDTNEERIIFTGENNNGRQVYAEFEGHGVNSVFDLNTTYISNMTHNFTLSELNASPFGDSIDDDEVDFADLTLADFTNDAGFITAGGAPAGQITINDTFIFWAERGSVVDNTGWSWGNGQTVTGGDIVPVDGTLTEFAAQCSYGAGTYLEVWIHKNDVKQDCLVNITNLVTHTVHRNHTCDLSFSKDDRIDIRAGTEETTFTQCVGIATFVATSTYNFEVNINQTRINFTEIEVTERAFIHDNLTFYNTTWGFVQNSTDIIFGYIGDM